MLPADLKVKLLSLRASVFERIVSMYTDLLDRRLYLHRKMSKSDLQRYINGQLKLDLSTSNYFLVKSRARVQMPVYVSHLTFISSIATQFPQRPCFRLPQFEPGTDDNAPHRKIIGWKDITYGKFLQDINLSAAYWTRTFKCPSGSIIGLWMLGMTYRDFVHLFGLLRARYVPQLLNLKIQSIEAAITHFKQTSISNVIYAPGAPPIAPLTHHFQMHEMVNIEQLPSLVQLEKSNALFTVSAEEDASGDDVVMIYHTSGSTSGRPKLVRYTRRWIDMNTQKPIPSIPNGKEVGIAINGIAHTSGLAMSLSQFKHGSCVVMMPWNDFTGAELVQIVKECKANALYQLTPTLCRVLREAMTNHELEEALKSLEYIALSGATLTEAERLYASEKGIRLKNMYGTTEMAVTMISAENASIFYPLRVPGLVYEFRSANAANADIAEVAPTSQIEDATTSPSSRLAELVIMPASLDCPHPTLCDPQDKCYHTKDLFELVAPSGYKYRGRSDDIIVMSNGQLCDTSYIEGQVLLTCSDLISTCVVVGSGRPSSVLLAEPVNNHPYGDHLKEEIGERVKEINKYGYSHERIHSSHVILISPGALPRTPKGNVIRKAAEQVFKQDINALFAKSD